MTEVINRSQSSSNNLKEVDSNKLSEKVKPAASKAPPTLEVARSSVEFLIDVLPYYQPCMVFVINHLFYYFGNGNLMWTLFIAFGINFPYFRWQAKTPSQEINLDRKSEKQFSADYRFMGPLYMYVLLDSLTWVWAMCVVSGVHPSFMPDSLFIDRNTQTLGGWLAFVFVWGYMSGVNGLAGHELIHKRNPADKYLGMWTYSKMFYSHFMLEHSSGHHRNIATPEDPATALLGENFYAFFVRSVAGGHRDTWERETIRLRMKHDVQEVPMLTQLTENRMCWFAALHIAMNVFILNIFGMRAFYFNLGYAFVGVFFIEVINYTEHYGLMRKKDARGIYEPITEAHSWNAASKSHLLFRIQRHSDHHMHAYRPYQILRKIDSAPTMPYMYLYTLLLALCPPLWMATMDQLL
jgi:alkane 1-monooxygenase